jgi:hypothetical protein
MSEPPSPDSHSGARRANRDEKNQNRMFLTAEQLEALTGYRKPALQRRWLLHNGYTFDVRADGRPAVLVAQVEARQTPSSKRGATELPDFSSLG